MQKASQVDKARAPKEASAARRPFAHLCWTLASTMRGLITRNCGSRELAHGRSATRAQRRLTEPECIGNGIVHSAILVASPFPGHWTTRSTSRYAMTQPRWMPSTRAPWTGPASGWRQACWRSQKPMGRIRVHRAVLSNLITALPAALKVFAVRDESGNTAHRRAAMHTCRRRQGSRCRRSIR